MCAPSTMRNIMCCTLVFLDVVCCVFISYFFYILWLHSVHLYSVFILYVYTYTAYSYCTLYAIHHIICIYIYIYTYIHHTCRFRNGLWHGRGSHSMAGERPCRPGTDITHWNHSCLTSICLLNPILLYGHCLLQCSDRTYNEGNLTGFPLMEKYPCYCHFLLNCSYCADISY